AVGCAGRKLRRTEMRVLVAGGAGFIGSNLCRRLLDEGNDVVCVDNLVTGRRKNIEPLMADARFAFLERDVIQPLEGIEGIDAVFHLASPASPPGYQRFALETMLVNSRGTQN